MAAIRVLAIAGGIALAAVGCRGDEPAPPPEPRPAGWRAIYDAWSHGDPIPDFPLVDHTGRAFTLGELRDRHVLIGFVFTRCPNPKACPLTMKKMKEVQDLWKAKEAGGETGGKRLHLLGLTLDPDFDRPPQLASFMEAHGWDPASASMATTAPGEAELLDEALPALFSVLALPSSDQILTHTVKVALVGPGLEPIREWSQNEFEPFDIVRIVLEEAPAER